ncbi:quinol dehydrogenase ferredoxin subunit NapH [Inhella proteolytica]|uniref:Quinol dehydrogenase ferredoxin subunit NapH n=1 Tax=Inhella proteolytica TaxID=2795029 RepID=A0A931JAX3_9BURK|nr:quinol dehydrogenase ferredoxin subunit NapH [Inhella proteolytica]MBH9579255.1 quinol dehydrogenase ferredoxin subunit NapH [Inhella proteolytica]
MLPLPNVAAKPWWKRQRWLLLRRLSQLGLFTLFLLGPLAGLWIVKGNLASSLTLGVLPLTDPFVLAQSLAAGHRPEAAALIGVGIVLAFYAVFGRVYCSWVCPVNLVSDSAGWLRRKLRISTGRSPSRNLRYWLLAAVLGAAFFSGQAVWEAVNPVTLTQRALIFGGSLAWGGALAVFLFELLVAPRGWCGHLCPHGAAYALLGSKPLLRVAATHSSRCNDCGDCYAVCPEPQVIVMPLKGKQGHGPVITDRECTACGRCADVCTTDVFRFTHRFDTRRD